MTQRGLQNIMYVLVIGIILSCWSYDAINNIFARPVIYIKEEMSGNTKHK
jgi:hypothetical protein